MIKLKIYYLLIIFNLTNNAVFSQSTLETSVKFDNELTLNLEHFFKSTEEGKKAVERFKKNFKQQIEGDIKVEIESIVMKAFKELYEITKAAAIKNSQKVFITGVRVGYGYDDAAKNILLQYEPWYLENIIIRGSYILGDIHLIDSGSVFIYSDSSKQFSKVKKKDIKQRLGNYKNKVKIKNAGQQNYRSVRTGSGKHIDTEYLNFSFQELFLLYHRNMDKCWNIQQDGVNPKCDYTRSITVYNSGDRRIFEMRHSVIFNCPDCEPPAFKILIEKEYLANLAHMCPPDCNSLVYNLK